MPCHIRLDASAQRAVADDDQSRPRYAHAHRPIRAQEIAKSLAVRTTIGVIHRLESQCAVWLNAPGKIRIPARNDHDVAVESAVFLERPSTINPGMKSVISAQQFKDGSLSQQLGCRTRNHQLVGIELIDDLRAR